GAAQALAGALDNEYLVLAGQRSVAWFVRGQTKGAVGLNDAVGPGLLLGQVKDHPAVLQFLRRRAILPNDLPFDRVDAAAAAGQASNERQGDQQAGQRSSAAGEVREAHGHSVKVMTSPSLRTASRRRLAVSMLLRIARTLPSQKTNWQMPGCQLPKRRA